MLLFEEEEQKREARIWILFCMQSGAWHRIRIITFTFTFTFRDHLTRDGSASTSSLISELQVKNLT